MHIQVEVEKKDSDEEPMEMVVEKMVDEPEAEADSEEKHVGPIVVDKMAEDLRPMDTDKESVVESKSPEESIQEDSGSDIAPMQTDDQLKQVRYIFVVWVSAICICNWTQNLLEFPNKLYCCCFGSAGCVCAWTQWESFVYS